MESILGNIFRSTVGSCAKAEGRDVVPSNDIGVNDSNTVCHALIQAMDCVHGAVMTTTRTKETDQARVAFSQLVDRLLLNIIAAVKSQEHETKQENGSRIKTWFGGCLTVAEAESMRQFLIESLWTLASFSGNRHHTNSPPGTMDHMYPDNDSDDGGGGDFDPVIRSRTGSVTEAALTKHNLSKLAEATDVSSSLSPAVKMLMPITAAYDTKMDLGISPAISAGAMSVRSGESMTSIRKNNWSHLISTAHVVMAEHDPATVLLPPQQSPESASSVFVSALRSNDRITASSIRPSFVVFRQTTTPFPELQQQQPNVPCVRVQSGVFVKRRSSTTTASILSLDPHPPETARVAPTVVEHPTNRNSSVRTQQRLLDSSTVPVVSVSDVTSQRDSQKLASDTASLASRGPMVDPNSGWPMQRPSFTSFTEQRVTTTNHVRTTAMTDVAVCDEAYPYSDFLKDFPCVTVNQYALIESVGKGCQGEVFSCLDMITGFQKAIKVIPRPRALLGSGTVGAARKNVVASRKLMQLQREVAIMKRCRHRNILALYEVIDDTEHDEMYLVMQLAQGGALMKLTPSGQASKKFSVGEVVHYGQQLCSGLKYLHERGIVHRDIKPDNVLLGEDGTVMLGDFGVSTFGQFGDASPSGSTTPTAKGAVPHQTTFKGTPAFLSPELFASISHSESLRSQNRTATGSSSSSCISMLIPTKSPPPSVIYAKHHSSVPVGKSSPAPELSGMKHHHTTCFAGKSSPAPESAAMANMSKPTSVETSSHNSSGFVAACRADVWALGMTLYVMRYGKLPWSLEGTYETFVKNICEGEILFDADCPDLAESVGHIASDSAHFISSFIADKLQNLEVPLSRQLDGIISMMLNRNPTARLTAAQSLQRLEQLEVRLDRAEMAATK